MLGNDGKGLGKARDREDATRRLRGLSGVTHRVVTGVTVLPPDRGEPLADVAETAVTFIKLSPSEIERYVASGEPDDKAGAYGIQGRLTKIETNLKDYLGGIRQLADLDRRVTRLELQRETEGMLE